MRTVLTILQIAVAIILVAIILIQQKGAGLGAGFGGGSSTLHTTRRGVDKTLHIATIIISIIFFAIALAQLLI